MNNQNLSLEFCIDEIYLTNGREIGKKEDAFVAERAVVVAGVKDAPLDLGPRKRQRQQSQENGQDGH